MLLAAKTTLQRRLTPPHVLSSPPPPRHPSRSLPRRFRSTCRLFEANHPALLAAKSEKEAQAGRSIYLRSVKRQQPPLTRLYPQSYQRPNQRLDRGGVLGQPPAILPVELFRPEKHIDTQADDQQTAIGQIDQDLHDFHIVALLWSALADAACAHDRGYGGNPTFEVATRKGICAHDRPLANRDLADVALIALGSTAKKRRTPQPPKGLWR